MAYVALGLGALLLLYLAARAFVRANPATLARALGWALVVLAGLGIIFLIVTERLGPALALAGGAAPLLLHGRRLWNRFAPSAGPNPGKVSEVETEFLRMTLDHDTGTMSGVVRRGPRQGSSLAELSREELVALWRECRAADEPSARLLETYLDRLQPGWRETAAAGAGADGSTGARHSSGAMTRAEAYEVLGLEPGASTAEIKAAHRRLMVKLHPDQGGSTYLAARVNQAKDLLLKG